MSLEKLQEKVGTQKHLLDFWNELNETERDQLSEQVERKKWKKLVKKKRFSVFLTKHLHGIRNWNPAFEGLKMKEFGAKFKTFKNYRFFPRSSRWTSQRATRRSSRLRSRRFPSRNWDRFPMSDTSSRLILVRTRSRTTGIRVSPEKIQIIEDV